MRGVAPDEGRIVAMGEPAVPVAAPRDLIAQLLPGVDADRLLRALRAERALPARSTTPGDPLPRYDSDGEVCARELQRVRTQFALGESARTLQHAFNNPLTALLAEAQLMELEELPDEARQAVGRMLGLIRRLAVLARRLGGEVERIG
jgi:signal transduction histidine kinase